MRARARLAAHGWHRTLWTCSVGWPKPCSSRSTRPQSLHGSPIIVSTPSRYAASSLPASPSAGTLLSGAGVASTTASATWPVPAASSGGSGSVARCRCSCLTRVLQCGQRPCVNSSGSGVSPQYGQVNGFMAAAFRRQRSQRRRRCRWVGCGVARCAGHSGGERCVPGGRCRRAGAGSG